LSRTFTPRTDEPAEVGRRRNIAHLPQVVAMVVCLALLLSLGLGITTLLTAGDPQRLFPQPFYGLMPVPKRGSTGGDFSQIYFGALRLRQQGVSPYERPSPDPFDRPPGYPMLTYWLAVPLTLLPYDRGLLAHMAGQCIVFAAATIAALGLTGCFRSWSAVFATVVPLLVLTPIGLTFIERGQFDLYVAASYVLVFTALFEPHLSLLAASGVLAAIKLTALPFLLILSVAIMAGADRPPRWRVLIAPAVVVASILVAPDAVRSLRAMASWELEQGIHGMTFVRLMPFWLAKALPLLTVLLAAAWLRGWSEPSDRKRRLLVASFPLAAALAIQGGAQGSVSYEYRAVALLGLVPALAIWLRGGDPPGPLAVLAGVGFAMFLPVAFRAHNLVRMVSATSMTAIHLGASLYFLGLTLWAMSAPAPPRAAVVEPPPRRL
jgi:hypothetical protein